MNLFYLYLFYPPNRQHLYANFRNASFLLNWICFFTTGEMFVVFCWIHLRGSHPQWWGKRQMTLLPPASPLSLIPSDSWAPHVITNLRAPERSRWSDAPPLCICRRRWLGKSSPPRIFLPLPRLRASSLSVRLGLPSIQRPERRRAALRVFVGRQFDPPAPYPPSPHSPSRGHLRLV